MSLLDTLDPILIPWAQKLVDLADRAGVQPKVTSARRSYSQQAALYKRFQEGRSTLPAAPPGTSSHEWGLAFDLIVPNPTDQTDLGVVWVRWGGVYGGSYDPVHFEYPNWRYHASLDPRSGTAGAGAPISYTPSPTADSISSKVLALADAIVLLVPSPLRGILSTAVIANGLTAYVGANPYGRGIEWLLSHPAEVTEAFVQAAWRILLSGKGK